ncbi:hypothetical protein PROFUN_01097 [Planoprotostelium fungivorum]|uniref:Chromatin modification-related protein MEAF6 n=1 Tax=Planoprotostelium fungivorum TaxID=1890364 RepID=A0A2P6NCB3_9EUKA|nr:hypothetical protein PROFUN_01097 [Planoprotostelium fungivorum]
MAYTTMHSDGVSGHWDVGICDCFDDFKVCCVTMFCLPCQLAYQNAAVNQTECSIVDCCLATCYPCICGCVVRGRIRDKYGIYGSTAGDLCCHFCFPCCATIQQTRQLDIHGAKPADWRGSNRTREPPNGVSRILLSSFWRTTGKPLQPIINDIHPQTMDPTSPLAPGFESIIENLRTPKEVTSELNRLAEKKKSTEEKLASLEKQIYALEGSYLHDTRNLGNILVGWDSYLSARSGALKRPQKYKDSDRLFSLSSITSVRYVDPSAQDSLGQVDTGAPEEEAVIRPTKMQKSSGNSKKSGSRKKKNSNNVPAVRQEQTNVGQNKRKHESEETSTELTRMKLTDIGSIHSTEWNLSSDVAWMTRKKKVEEVSVKVSKDKHAHTFNYR